MDHHLKDGTAVNKQPPPGAWAAAPKVITQQMLAEFLQLKAMAAKLKALESYLKAALEAGVGIEPGPHTATLECRQTRYLTAALIIERLGLSPERVKALRASADLRTTRTLKVR